MLALADIKVLTNYYALCGAEEVLKDFIYSKSAKENKLPNKMHDKAELIMNYVFRLAIPGNLRKLVDNKDF